MQFVPLGAEVLRKGCGNAFGSATAKVRDQQKDLCTLR